MAEDPTTTGPEVSLTFEGREITPAEHAALMRAYPGAHVREHSAFNIPLKGDLLFTVLNNQLTISLEIGPAEGGEPYRFALDPQPLEHYGGPDILNAYLAAVKQNYFKILRNHLQQEAGRLMQVVCMGLYFMANPGSGDRETIIAGYTNDVAARLSEMLGALPEKQKHGSWSKIALQNAVFTAAVRLALEGTTGRALTLEAVNEKLRPEFKDFTPSSGEALRKQLEERGLSWRGLKRAAERHAATLEKLRAPESETGG